MDEDQEGSVLSFVHSCAVSMHSSIQFLESVQRSRVESGKNAALSKSSSRRQELEPLRVVDATG